MNDSVYQYDKSGYCLDTKRRNPPSEKDTVIGKESRPKRNQRYTKSTKHEAPTWLRISGYRAIAGDTITKGRPTRVRPGSGKDLDASSASPLETRDAVRSDATAPENICRAVLLVVAACVPAGVSL